MEVESFRLMISLAAATTAIITITTHYQRTWSLWLLYIFKPLTTSLILVVALLPQSFVIQRYGGAIALGLLCSLCGDIWLMLPHDRFLYGLISFMLTHLCYIYAFTTHASAAHFPWPIFPLLLIGLIILRYLWPGLKPALRVPVSLYVGAIIVMVGLAVNQPLAYLSLSTLSVAGGALLLLISDTLLAINRFRRPFHLAHVAVLGTYFAGQLLIAWSVGLSKL